MQKRNRSAEIRRIVPEAVREDLAASGFMIVDTRTLKLLQSQLEITMEDLVQSPRSQKLRTFGPKTIHALALCDALLE